MGPVVSECRRRFSEASLNWHLSTLLHPAVLRPQCIASQDFSPLTAIKMRRGSKYWDVKRDQLIKTNLCRSELHDCSCNKENFFYYYFIACIFGNLKHICNSFIDLFLFSHIATSISIPFVFYRRLCLKYTQADWFMVFHFSQHAAWEAPECSDVCPLIRASRLMSFVWSRQTNKGNLRQRWCPVAIR